MGKNDEGSEEPKGCTVDYFGLLFYGVLTVVFLVALPVNLHAGLGWPKAMLFAASIGIVSAIGTMLVLILLTWGLDAVQAITERMHRRKPP